MLKFSSTFEFPILYKMGLHPFTSADNLVALIKGNDMCRIYVEMEFKEFILNNKTYTVLIAYHAHISIVTRFIEIMCIRH